MILIILQRTYTSYKDTVITEYISVLIVMWCFCFLYVHSMVSLWTSVFKSALHVNILYDWFYMWRKNWLRLSYFYELNEQILIRSPNVLQEVYDQSRKQKPILKDIINRLYFIIFFLYAIRSY